MKIYRAVIENNKDPEHQGRYQVRIFGLQDGAKGGFETCKTEELPWAECMGPTAFGLIGQTGISSIMHQGTWVYVILQDDDPNLPIIVGTVIGVSKTEESGFGDPEGKFPQTPGLDLGFIANEKYNFNQVIKTQCGHMIEIDDSSGDERIHVFHKTGSYLLIDNFGDIYVNGVRDAHYTIARDVTWEIGRDLSVHVGRDASYNIEHDRTERVGNDASWSIEGERTETDHKSSVFNIKKDRTETVDNNSTYHTKGNRQETVDKNSSFDTKGNRSENVKGNSSFDTKGTRNENIGSSSSIKTGGSLTENIGGNASFNVSHCSFSGAISVSRNSTASDHISSGVSGKGHVHGGVKGGPGMTQPPR